MSSIEKIIGSKITGFRCEKDLTQAELAEKVGITFESISRLERGVTFPSLKTVHKIAIALDVPLKKFFDFEDEEDIDKDIEREIAKTVGFLRGLSPKEIKAFSKVTKALVDATRFYIQSF